MSSPMNFTYAYLKQEWLKVLAADYQVITCAEYVDYKKKGLTHKVIVNRIDIDFSVQKTEFLIDIFNELGIKGSFFLRLHAPEYNPFSFENYRIIKKMVDSGHELAHHSEVIDQSAIWNEDPADCLMRDVKVMEHMFGVEIKGTASHGGLTGLNNLDFWKNKRPADYGFLYEGYDKEPEFNLFQESLYVSDSEWTRWKSYSNGVLNEGDRRSLSDHVTIGEHQVVYSLIHPDTYYHRHCYEAEGKA